MQVELLFMLAHLKSGFKSQLNEDELDYNRINPFVQTRIIVHIKENFRP